MNTVCARWPHATSTKNDTPVASFVNSGEKQQSYPVNQGCEFEPNLKESRLFCQLQKTACLQKESN